MAWYDNLQPASFRGLGFGVRENVVRRGRRTAVHEYPYRDVVWVEDLGRGKRVYQFSGFLVGDDVYQQRVAFDAAVDMPGSGVLVHPSLGAKTVAVVEFEVRETAERGRIVELAFTAIETQGAAIYPSSSTDTQSAVGIASSDALGSILGDYGDDMDDATAGAAAGLGGVVSSAQNVFASAAGIAAQTQAVVQGAVGTVSGFVGQVRAAVNDASMTAHAVIAIPGNFGRYANGSRTLLQGALTVEQALGTMTAAAASVNRAGDAAMSLVAAL